MPVGKAKRTLRATIDRARAVGKSLLKDRACSSDRRCRFRDLRSISSENRRPDSSLLQFYSSANNIGNYLPVLGIREMLPETPDTWCMHDRKVDFEFINSNYKGVIIGGAGLLHGCFEPFWQKLSEECKLPMVVWGVGICAPDSEENPGVSKSVVSDVMGRCDLVNVRDDLTANWYKMKRAHISPCPTIAYIDKWHTNKNTSNEKVLFSMHRQLISDRESRRIEHVASALDGKTAFTDNDQKVYQNIDDIIEEDYAGSRAVITTRLHGAIIAYGLQIPYVAIPRDEKVRAFHSRYSNGTVVEDISAIESALDSCSIEKEVDLSSVYSFGKEARRWYYSLRP